MVVGFGDRLGAPEGGGAGPGFWPNATGTRNPAASTNSTKTRVPWLTDLFTGRNVRATKVYGPHQSKSRLSKELANFIVFTLHLDLCSYDDSAVPLMYKVTN